ncbi:hypothetical protein Anas_00602 [Armadillidium nasatum]|uniref:Uncharacterized protein n=1 Tax=Armadillidium nasatum TaxID=96803 RepID=A0A5N5TPC0_9CRUS|nr:hypothetical protein Anas_00602 [Armadillidium nasatum]
MHQVSDRCLQQAKTNMKRMPESSSTSTSESGSGQDMRSMKLLKHFWMEYMMKGVECFLTELKMFDTQKKILDINGLTGYVKKFEGWNGIERERDQVIAAITECAKAYEEDMDSNDDDDDHHHHHMMRNNMNKNNMNNNNMNNNNMMNNNMMNNTEHKEMKQLMKRQSKYDKCFSPKFAEICGVNNEISDFFFPMMNPKFLGKRKYTIWLPLILILLLPVKVTSLQRLYGNWWQRGRSDDDVVEVYLFRFKISLVVDHAIVLHLREKLNEGKE